MRYLLFELFDAIVTEAEFQLSVRHLGDCDWTNADRRYFIAHYDELTVETRVQGAWRAF